MRREKGQAEKGSGLFLGPCPFFIPRQRDSYPSAIEKTTNLTKLYKVVDNDKVALQISPALVCALGIDEFKLHVSGVRLGQKDLGFGIRYEGTSDYRPWKGPWSDGVWNADKDFPIVDAPLTPAGKKLGKDD